MSKKLTWLHVSDIHFHSKTEWRDSPARESLLTYLEEIFAVGDSPRPDLIFCTGDIAFGETDASPLAAQYEQAATFFDSLRAACGRDGTPLPRERLFVVPGNHDVNRSIINRDAQATLTSWASRASEHAREINERFAERRFEFTEAIKRLDEYAGFVRTHLPHQEDAEGRHRYARVEDIGGMKVGVAGFNSAWSCAGPEDDRTLWMAAEWQFNAAQLGLKDADISIGLIHHPPDWLNKDEQDLATHRIVRDFHFWLHGHLHNAWVVPAPSHVTIAAGAVGAEAPDEFGINLVSLDLDAAKGEAYLHTYSPKDRGWKIHPVVGRAPHARWRFDLPEGLRGAAVTPAPLPTDAPQPAPATAPPPPPPPKRTAKLFGREGLIKDATAKLRRQPSLLVYGLRGNGKTSLIEALGQSAPLADKSTPIRFAVTPSTTADDLFRQFARPLGETAEAPEPPTGDAKTIAAEIRRRYPKPSPAWVWLEHAHHLLDAQGSLRSDVRNLMFGLQQGLGMQWHWVLELRERPAPLLLGTGAAECEVPGLDRQSLAECLTDAAPPGREADWRYSGDKLKGIFQWLGGGQGGRAHTLAIQLLIEVARGHDETPYEALRRHLGDFEQKIEESLLGDLYNNVLGPAERRMIQALALYRSSIPHDHAEKLETRLSTPGAWDRLDRRCLLSANADHSHYYLHSFIAGWLRTGLGYEGHGEEDDAEFADETTEHSRRHARGLHSAIAACWLDELRGHRRVTNLNIGRALEAFHHLVAAGETARVHDIAVELLTGNLAWAVERIRSHYDYLFLTRAPIAQQRMALQYWVVLDPEAARAFKFLGECWVKEEGRKSLKALACFEEACRLEPDYPPNWANLGRALLAHGSERAGEFLRRLEELERDCPQAIHDPVRSIQAQCLELTGQSEQAAALRMGKIQDGSRDPVFYNDEAKSRLEAGDAEGALEILGLAEKNRVTNEFTVSIKASALQRSGRAGEATDLRMEKILAGSRDPAFYADEANTRLDAGDVRGALEILDLAASNGGANEVTASIRARALRKYGGDSAGRSRD